ncbi:hypothetical protein HDU99_005135, partial [Rhizoclosmatium hyalinum]
MSLSTELLLADILTMYIDQNTGIHYYEVSSLRKLCPELPNRLPPALKTKLEAKGALRLLQVGRDAFHNYLTFSGVLEYVRHFGSQILGCLMIVDGRDAILTLLNACFNIVPESCKLYVSLNEEISVLRRSMLHSETQFTMTSSELRYQLLQANKSIEEYRTLSVSLQNRELAQAVEVGLNLQQRNANLQLTIKHQQETLRSNSLELKQWNEQMRGMEAKILSLQQELAKCQLSQLGQHVKRLENERQQYQELCAVRVRRIDELERRLLPFETVFKSSAGAHLFKNIIAVSELDKVDARKNPRMELLELASLALSKNVLNDSRLIWDFIYSQIKFYTLESLHGPAVFNQLFSPRLLLFLDKFFARCGKAAYDYWRGMGTDGERTPQNFNGFVWLPHSRTMQNRFAQAAGSLQYIGYDETIGNLIAAQFHTIATDVREKGREIMGILGSDEKDIGIVDTAIEIINGQKKVRGTQDLGGYEEEFQSWIIPDYVTSLSDLENLLNDLWKLFKKIAEFLEGNAHPVDFRTAFSDPSQSILSLSTKLRTCLSKLASIIPSRLADALKARDSRRNDNAANNKTQFNALLTLQRLETLVKDYEGCSTSIDLTLNKLADCEAELMDTSQSLAKEYSDYGLTAAHQTISRKKEVYLRVLEEAVSLNERIHLLVAKRAHKLAVYSLSDTQRRLNQPIALFYVDTVTEQQSRLIENRILHICRDKNIPVILSVYDGASHSLVQRAGDSGETPTTLTSLAASIAKDIDKRFKGNGKTVQMKNELLPLSLTLLKNASWIHFSNHRARKWLCAPPISISVQSMPLDQLFDFLDTVVRNSEQVLDTPSWILFRDRIVNSKLNWGDVSFNFDQWLESLELEEMNLFDNDRNQIWGPFFFSYMSTICRFDTLKMHETREWLVRHIFLETVRAEPFWLDHFYKPAQNPASPNDKIWKAIDPPHWMKRLATQLSGDNTGYKDFADHDLFLQIANTLETKLIPLFFTKHRDKQNVPDAFTLFGKDVQLKASELGFWKVAGMLNLIQRLYEACDGSGLSACDRDRRFDEFLEWADVHYFPDVFGCIPSDRVPARPQGDRDIPENIPFEWENKGLPSELMEAIVSFVEVRNQIKAYLESCAVNNPASVLAVLIERAMGTNNLETEMSVLRMFEGILTCGRVSQIDPIKAHLSVRKYRYAQLLRLRFGSDEDPGYIEAPSRGRSYISHTNDESRWEAEEGEPDTINSNRHSKDTTADKIANSSALAIRELTIRDKHRLNFNAAILTSKLPVEEQ